MEERTWGKDEKGRGGRNDLGEKRSQRERLALHGFLLNPFGNGASVDANICKWHIHPFKMTQWITQCIKLSSNVAETPDDLIILELCFPPS